MNKKDFFEKDENIVIYTNLEKTTFPQRTEIKVLNKNGYTRPHTILQQ